MCKVGEGSCGFGLLQVLAVAFKENMRYSNLRVLYFEEVDCPIQWTKQM